MQQTHLAEAAAQTIRGIFSDKKRTGYGKTEPRVFCLCYSRRRLRIASSSRAIRHSIKAAA